MEVVSHNRPFDFRLGSPIKPISLLTIIASIYQVIIGIQSATIFISFLLNFHIGKPRQHMKKGKQDIASMDTTEAATQIKVIQSVLVHNKITVICSLDKEAFTFTDNKRTGSIRYDAMFAVHKKQDHPNTFVIYAVDLKKELRLIQEYVCPTSEQCDTWVFELKCKIFKVSSKSADTSALFKERKVLVIINPNSGRKLANSYFAKHVKPILDHAHLKYTIFKTEYANHAFDYCKSLPLGAFDEIVTMGGDGVLYEAINGIMSRPDWREVSAKIRFGVIPAGTGNGLATVTGAIPNISHASTPQRAAFIVARGFYSPLDLMSVYQKDKRAFSFLSITWAAIADVDLGTENLRWMGGARNLVGAVKSILKQKYYRGKIQYIEADEYNRPSQERISPFTHRKDTTTPTSNKPEAPACHLLTQHLSEEFKSHCPKQFAIQKSFEVSQQASIPAQVKTIEDDFFLFIVSNITHLSYDFVASPAAHMHDGAVDLVMMRKKMKRAEMLKLFTDTETGKHVESDSVEVRKIRAFAFYPIEDGSYVAIDGEKLDYAPVFCEVHQGLINMMTY
ncbi:sphingosine kinase A [Acrasis kona]|uniref:Sphingosine kinase A n=1 Tax=Acrasis kona TaxID=1008807 RepID=A0AAW2ZFS0_9EUKA